MQIIFILAPIESGHRETLHRLVWLLMYCSTWKDSRHSSNHDAVQSPLCTCLG